MKKEAIRAVSTREPLRYTFYSDPSLSTPKEALIKPRLLSDSELSKQPSSELTSYLETRAYAYHEAAARSMFPLLVERGNDGALELAALVLDFSLRRDEISLLRKDASFHQASYDDGKLALRGSTSRNFAKALFDLQKVHLIPKQHDLEEAQALEIQNQALSLVVIKNYLLCPDGYRKLEILLQDIHDYSDIPHASVLDVIDTALEALANPKNIPFIRDSLRYKPENSNLNSFESASVLRQLLVLAFPDQNTPDSPLKDHLRLVSLKLLEAYRKYPPKDDPTPHLAFLHDLFFAASQQNDISRLKKVSDWLDQSSKEEPSHQQQLIKEISVLEKLFAAESNSFGDFLVTDLAILRCLPEPDDARILELSVKAAKRWRDLHPPDFAIGPYTDRFEGLVSAAHALPEKSVLAFLRKKEAPENLASSRLPVDVFLYNTVSACRYLAFPKHITLDGIISNLIPKVDYSRRTGLSTGSMPPKSFPGSLDTLLPHGFNAIVNANSAVTSLYLEDPISSNEVDLLRQKTENESLLPDIFSGIFEGKRWFVSSAGDTFLEIDNPDQRGKIKSLCFFQDTENRGYRVRVELPENIHQSVLEFIVSPDGLFYANGFKASLPYWLQTPFENFIYKRLHFIVSGQANDFEVDTGDLKKDQVSTPSKHRRQPAHIRRYDRYLNRPEYLKKKRELKNNHVVDLWSVATEWSLIGAIGPSKPYKDVGYVNEESDTGQYPSVPRRLRYHQKKGQNI